MKQSVKGTGGWPIQQQQHYEEQTSGVYVKGNITSGGDICGRDKVVHGGEYRDLSGYGPPPPRAKLAPVPEQPVKTGSVGMSLTQSKRQVLCGLYLDKASRFYEAFGGTQYKWCLDPRAPAAELEERAHAYVGRQFVALAMSKDPEEVKAATHASLAEMLKVIPGQVGELKGAFAIYHKAYVSAMGKEPDADWYCIDNNIPSVPPATAAPAAPAKTVRTRTTRTEMELESEF
jgi:hypothetical protein